MTLCALFQPESQDRTFKKLLKSFNLNHEVSPELSHFALTKCLNMVTSMNNAEGTAASLAKYNKSYSIKFDMKERGRDLLQPFF